MKDDIRHDTENGLRTYGGTLRPLRQRGAVPYAGAYAAGGFPTAYRRKVLWRHRAHRRRTMRVVSPLCTPPGDSLLGRWGPASQASPRRSAAVAASTGTVTGCGAPATAQSGSLRPLPVTVHTIRWPGSTLPCSAAFSRPATDAAEAGSTKTPS